MQFRATALLIAAAACKAPAPAAEPSAGVPTAATAPATAPATEPAAAPVEACLDAQLSRLGLNPYGDPPGTMYAGGTPLFDESSGKRTDRAAYIFARHPDIRRACAPEAGP